MTLMIVIITTCSREVRKNRTAMFKVNQLKTKEEY